MVILLPLLVAAVCSFAPARAARPTALRQQAVPLVGPSLEAEREHASFGTVNGPRGRAWSGHVALAPTASQPAHQGRPLFADDFETDPFAAGRWVFLKGGACQHAYDAAEDFRGGGSLRAGPGDAMWGRWYCQQRLPVRPGRRYRVSGYIKTKAVRHGVPGIALVFYRGDRAVGTVQTPNVYASEWTPAQGEGTAPPDAEWAQVTCEASGLEGIAWFDAIQVLELPHPGVWLGQVSVAGSPHWLEPGRTLGAWAVLRNPLPAPRHLDLEWRLTDVEGELHWQRSGRVVLHRNARVSARVGRWSRLGYYRLELRVLENGVRLATVARDVPVLPGLPRRALPHVPFAVIAANQYALVKGGLKEDVTTWRRFARMMRAAGVTNLRVWHHWTEAVHADGRVKLSPSIYDLVCRIAREEGIRISMVFWMVPPWARGPEEDWHCYRFMQEAARYYAALGVDRFEIDNEPEASQRYIDRLKAGFLGVKRANPSAEALMAGLFWYHRRPNEGFFTYAGSAFNALGELAAPYTDRINWHEYYQSPPEQPLWRDLAVHRGICDAHFAGSYGASLYMTETAYWAFSPGPAGHVTELEQAQWGVREYLTTLRGCALDMDNKAFWYYYLDDNSAPYYACAMSGLLRYDMSPKPSYVAMRALAPLLEGAEPVGGLDLGEPLRALVWRRGAEPVVALWSVGEPADTVVNVGRTRVTVSDLWGNRRVAAAPGGHLAIRLTGSVQYVLGADPAAVFPQALIGHLSRATQEVPAQSWSAAAPALTRLSEALARLGARGDASGLPAAAAAAERAVSDLVDDLAAGRVTMREAAPRFSLLRAADGCRMGAVLLASPASREVSGNLASRARADAARAIAEAAEAEREAVAAVGPLSGQVRARLFLQLGQRRLARARWQQQQGWSPAVNAETARLATRDLRLAVRLSRVEPNPRLDVWLSSPRYELQAAGGAVEFPVAVHNASDAPVEGQLTFVAPPGWRVEATSATFRVAAQQRTVVPCRAEPGPEARGRSVLMVRARLGDRETLPIAFELEAAQAVSLRWRLQDGVLALSVRNNSDAPIPESVLSFRGVSPARIAER